jgi:polyhydroxyalkanoate synthase
VSQRAEPPVGSALGLEGEQLLGSMLRRLTRWQVDSAYRASGLLLERQQQMLVRALHWPNVVHSALTTRTGVTPHDVVFESGSLRLLRYRRASPATQPRPLLICYALINRPYILDLQQRKSVVQRYLDEGFDVYLIDWGTPTSADRELSLAHYVRELLRGVVARISSAHGGGSVHLLGYCMGGTLSALHAALEPSSVATLTLLAAPIDFSGRESLLNVWADARYFDVDAFIDANGNCPGWFLQQCFLLTKPIQNLVEKNVGFLEQLDDPRFVSSFFAMERWLNDNIPMAGETFRDFVKKLYQRNELVRGEMMLGDRLVSLAHIDCPLLLLTAKHDHLVAPASTLAMRAHVSSRHVTELMIDAGHVGLVVSSRAHQTLWPEATRWLAEHGTAGHHRPVEARPS